MGEEKPSDTEGSGLDAFVKHWGWRYITYQMSVFYNRTEDDIYRWNVYRYLSALAFMKDKSEYDMALEKERQEQFRINGGRY